ncbi:ABC transporter ATP-binding protein [Jiulongibacter sp. NS-SX5]|uniref:ABC transporter ATP-binding protein n=1 Tax=Jiulongibacter sp. NS-SX5 TaxID=3463854 RepID=UPI0040584D07
MLEVFSLQKSYQSQLILEVPSLEIPKGVSWFQGVNGSGKSTFFKAVAGLIPFEGQIIWNGIDQLKEPVEYRRKVNYCQAESQYPPFLTAKELIDYHKEVYQTSHNDAEELVNLFEVNKFINQQIGTFSSGMIKKLSLVLAMIGEPELLLLDEPLTTIDVASQNTLLKFLADLGTSVFIASHHELPSDLLKIDHHYKVEHQRITRV